MDDTQRPEIENLWQRIELLLQDTKALLPGEADLEWLDAVMQTEQFELAIDELIRLGDAHRPASGYWANLVSAAGLIGRPERIGELRAREEQR